MNHYMLDFRIFICVFHIWDLIISLREYQFNQII